MYKEKTIKQASLATKAKAATDKASNKIDVNEINTELILKLVMKTPAVKVDRKKYLKKELIKHYPEQSLAIAIEKNAEKDSNIFYGVHFLRIGYWLTGGKSIGLICR